MISIPDLTALLADPALAAEVPAEVIPEVIGELERLKATLWARLTVPVPASRNGGPESPSTRYVTQAEAAAMFGIPLGDVRYLTRRRLVPAIGKGKNKRLYPPDLARHLERCRMQGLAVRGIPDVSSPR